MPPELDVALRVLTTLGALGGIALLFRARVEKRKIKAETAKVEIDASVALAGTALSLITPLRAENEQCRDQVDRLREQLARRNNES